MSILTIAHDRKSPYTFDGTPVQLDEIDTAFEAARWAASAYNTQPWRFIYAPRDTQGFDDLLTHAIPFNQNWLQHAGGIGVVCVRTHAEHNGEEDPTAAYCTGMAMGQFSLELTAIGYQMHQLSAFDANGLKSACNIPDPIVPIAMFGIGKTGRTDTTSDDLMEMEAQREKRERKPLAEILISPDQTFER